MKKLALYFSALALAMGVTSLNAQQPQFKFFGQGSNVFNAALAKLFGDVKAFSCDAVVEAKDNSNGSMVTAPMKFSMLNGVYRMEINITEMKSAQMSPQAVAMMTQLGMDKFISITRPAQGKTLVIFPNLQAYTEQTLPAGEFDPEKIEIASEALGNETVNDHACVKNKISFTDSEGKDYQGFTWTAKDLKNFPVKMQFVDDDGTVEMSYQNVKLANPPESDFEAPDNFKKYDDMQSLMQGVMARNFNSSTK